MKKLLLLTFLSFLLFPGLSFSQASGSVDLGSEITNSVTTGGCSSGCIPAVCSSAANGDHSVETVTLTITGIPVGSSAEITFTSIECASTSGLDGGDDIFIDGTKIFDGSGNAIVDQTECVAGGADIVIEFTVNRRDEAINVAWESGVTDPAGTDCFLEVVPVELISFDGKINNKEIDLNWSTASEENNSHFEIEHSLNGRDFTYLGKVNGVGTTSEVQNYGFTDNEATTGKNYYRLRQVDLDGAFEYSSIVTVTMRADAVIEVRPTMVTSLVQVMLEEGLTTEVALQIVDITGRQLQTATIAKGAVQFDLEVSNLEKGAYFIQFNVAGEIITRRFVKM